MRNRPNDRINSIRTNRCDKIEYWNGWVVAAVLWPCLIVAAVLYTPTWIAKQIWKEI